jgi:hypothetical protein
MRTPNPDDEKLRGLLRQARPAPPLPPGFEDSVWRRIERSVVPAVKPEAVAWFDRLLELLLRPRLALSGIAVLLLLSSVAGVLSGTEAARRSAQDRYLAAVAPATVR